MAETILSVESACVTFDAHDHAVKALDGVSLEVRAGETLAVVGESGCGKTTLARSILGLQRLDSGTIRLDGREVRGVSAGMARHVGMVWQDPYASLDPRWSVRRIVSEPLRLDRRSDPVEPLLDEVGLSAQFADRYPHELSGGQRQRVAIARALALRPPLVLCDEPTAALDLSVQAQVLNLLRDIQAQLGCAFLFISHDLMTVRYLADRVVVMNSGQVVEEGSATEVFDNPTHPYTRTLLDSALSLKEVGKLPAAPIEPE